MARLGVAAWCATAFVACAPPTQPQTPAPAEHPAQPSPPPAGPVVAPAPAAPPPAAPADPIRLPDAGGHWFDVSNALPVWVTPAHIFVEDARVLSLPPKAERARYGVGPAFKRRGPNDLYIVPLGREAEQRRHGRATSVLYMDAATEYRLVVEVIHTLGQSGAVHHLLATTYPTAAEPGRARGWLTSVPNSKRANATVVLLVNEGTSVKFGGQNVPPDCTSSGPGMTLPKVSAEYDFAGLTRCMRRLLDVRGDEAGAHDLDPHHGGIAANPGTRLSDVLLAAQALYNAGVTSFGLKVPR